MKQNKNIFFCFSPPIMLGTFMVEIGLSLYSFFKLKKSRVKNLIIFTLLLLATFQLSEYFVCSGSGLSEINIASRIGYVAITFLPPLGIHLLNEIVGRRKHWTILFSYSLAICFTLFFLLYPNSINDSICTGNYVIFSFYGGMNLLYGVYYFGLLLFSIGLASYFVYRKTNKKLNKTLFWFIFGILSFLLPTGIIFLLAPSTGQAIPSIMCGFAIIYALILVDRIAPSAISKK